MSGYFRFGRAGRGADDPWFRIGGLDVGTTMLVVLLSVVSLVLYAVEPVDKPVSRHLALLPGDALTGQVWMLLTWPLANLNVTLWTALNIFFFWYFGSEVESNLGKRKMAWFLGWLALLLGLVWVALCRLLPYGDFYLFGLDLIGLLVLLVFIAEYPQRRFFFNIPGWVIGVVLVGIQVVQLLGQRVWLNLYHLLIGLVVTAVVARSAGLLVDYAWIPAVRVPHPSRRRRASRDRWAGRRPTGPTVVPGPWQPAPEPPVSPDQAALDALLDKISASGMDSLTDHERDQLMVLRDRLRKRS